MDVKLSILVPVFNWDISSLLAKLYEEIKKNSSADKIELIFVDDCSSNENLKDLNRIQFSEYKDLKIVYLELEKNVGRAAIRNLLVQKSLGEYLLFLDTDVLPDSSGFISKYWSYVIANNYDVICGGISYNNRIIYGTEFEFYLYLYGKKGVKSAEERNLVPWRQLLTSNIMVRRNILKEIPFDERFHGYGYEDNEWGIRIMHSYTILHIDNTVSHLGIESKDAVYNKMRESIAGYSLLAKTHPEVFKRTHIAILMRYFEWLSDNALNVVDQGLKKIYFGTNINWILYIIFQLNKVILLTIKQKKDNKVKDAK
ncbi:MAG: glycosyl transferase family 2 [Pelosinus sp.]|jgi:glycosyltransferase involved in cell wall biosynthesis|nr:glycosyl transferase family 2 [Pelosinus sp.]